MDEVEWRWEVLAMPSPFPGMNPYLEQNYDWNEFHQNYISRMQEFLAHRVGPKYFVKSEVRLFLHERSAEERKKWPAVVARKRSNLEIRDARNRILVTVIEVLSPSDKDMNGDYEPYMNKRRCILDSPSHFVEIDLRRGGYRPEPPRLPPSDYYTIVSQREDRPKLSFWPIGLRDRLPVIPVPLIAPDPPVSLDLKAILDIVYDAFEYGNHIYLETPDPPLSPDDATWARQVAALEQS